MNLEDYFLEGLEHLQNEQYIKAYETFQAGLACESPDPEAPETLRYKNFFTGMIHYEDAPKNSESLNPQDYLKSVENFISANEHGLDHYYLYYYLGDTAAKIGIGAKSSPFHKAVKYIYQSFGIQSFVRCTTILSELDPKGALAKRALHKATSLFTYHHKDGKLLADAKTIATGVTEDVLTGKTACTPEEWQAFLVLMKRLLNPMAIPKPPKKRFFLFR